MVLRLRLKLSGVDKITKNQMPERRYLLIEMRTVKNHRKRQIVQKGRKKSIKKRRTPKEENMNVGSVISYVRTLMIFRYVTLCYKLIIIRKMCLKTIYEIYENNKPFF